MENIVNFVKPELLVLIPALYFVGDMLKSSEFPNKLIPAALGGCGVVLAALYVVATSAGGASPQGIAMAIFTGATQGIITAGLSVYVNQLFKQAGKVE